MKEKIQLTRFGINFQKALASACCLSALTLCSGMSSASAAGLPEGVDLTAVRMQRAGGQVYVSFAVKIAPRTVNSHHRWVVTPCLNNASDSLLLNPFVVTGRVMARREKQQQLLNGSSNELYRHLTARNGDTFLYTDTLRYAPWMESGLNLRLDIDREGCCRVQTLGSIASSASFPVSLPYRPSIGEVAPRVSQAIMKYAADYPFLCEVGSDPVRRNGLGIRFHVASSVVDTLYSSNADNIKKIMEAIDLLRTDSCAYMKGIKISGYASPEGNTEMNRRLSASRANALSHTISVRKNIPMSMFKVNAGGIDWERLAELVNKSDMAYKKEVIDILRSHPEEERNGKLQALAGGRPYRSALDVLYPQLRDACYIAIEYANRPDKEAETVNRAIAAIRVRNYEEAFRLLKTVEADKRSWNARGVCHLLCGDDKEAGIWLRKAAKAGDKEAADNLKKMNTKQQAITTGIIR